MRTTFIARRRIAASPACARQSANGCMWHWTSGGTSCGEDLKWLGEAAERLRIAAEAPKPILMGRDLIALGYKPSPQFGKWLDACFEAQLDGAFSDHDGALAWFKENLQK